MSAGTYHADNEDVPAVKVADGNKADDGTATDNLVVFSDGGAGSGLSGPADIRRDVKRGDETGEWTPA
jgi:hypothetical protein